MRRRGDRHQLGDALNNAEHSHLRIAEGDKPGIDAAGAGIGHKFLPVSVPLPHPASITRSERVNLAFHWSGVLWSISNRQCHFAERTADDQTDLYRGSYRSHFRSHG